jgi:uncharacterized protein (TIGR02145 family)
LSVPYALHSASADNAIIAANGFSNVSITGDTLFMSNGNFIIVPGISVANYPVFVSGQGVSDIDGKFYPSIVINGQEWMQQNLAVAKYRNGDQIPTGLSDGIWSNTTSGAYAIYNNDASNNTTYGKLYNWYAVNDSRGLCPTGWHVPSDAEWTTLINYLDPNQNASAIGTQSSVAGGKMKSTSGWNSPNFGATNVSGFTGLPGGYKNGNGAYTSIGTDGGWWSSSEQNSNFAGFRYLSYTNSNLERFNNVKQLGFSLRCLRDTEASLIQGCTDGSACNFLAVATQDNGSCLYPNATCDDGNANTMNDVIGVNCICSGILMANGCTNAQACNYNPAANVDNGSCLIQGATCNDGNANTTNDVINANCQCAGTAINTGNVVIGQDYQGGKVAYIFQPGDAGYVAGETHGLIAAAQDLPGTYQWGCFDMVVTGAYGVAIGTGAQNTVGIVNAGCGLAAQACADLVLNGYSDWFLPSWNELEQLDNNRTAIGGFQNAYYWSSSEYNSNGAWRFYFYNGDASGYPKTYGNYVRPVRAY